MARLYLTIGREAWDGGKEVRVKASFYYLSRICRNYSPLQIRQFDGVTLTNRTSGLEYEYELGGIGYDQDTEAGKAWFVIRLGRCRKVRVRKSLNEYKKTEKL